MTRNIKFSSLLILLSFSLLTFGCDDDSENEPDRVFEAELSAMNDDNENIASADADVEMTIDGDMLTVRVDAEGVASGTLHPQHIHASGSCPSASADENDDGFVDVIEGVPSYGEIFIPLDNDLANLESQTSFPNPSGNEYEYMQTVSISELEASADEDLNLDGRHIVLHGVSSDVDLPESVQTLGETSANLTLPIACGAISEVQED